MWPICSRSELTNTDCCGLSWAETWLQVSTSHWFALVARLRRALPRPCRPDQAAPVGLCTAGQQESTRETPHSLLRVDPRPEAACGVWTPQRSGRYLSLTGSVWHLDLTEAAALTFCEGLVAWWCRLSQQYLPSEAHSCCYKPAGLFQCQLQEGPLQWFWSETENAAAAEIRTMAAVFCCRTI